MNTTKPEKIEQFNAVAETYHYPVRFMRITALGKPSHSPSELEGSFKGNKNKKLKSCARHLSQFSHEQVAESLQTLGFSPDDLDKGKIKLYGVAEDSGFSFHRNIPQRRDAAGKTPDERFVEMFFNTGDNGPYASVADKELVNAIHKKEFYRPGEQRDGKYVPGAPFPGVETVNVLSATFGAQNLFRLAKLTMKKLGMPVDREAVRPDQQLEIKDHSVLGAFEWRPGQRQPFGSFKESEQGESNNIFDGSTLEQKSKAKTDWQDGADRRRNEHTSYRYSVQRHQAARGNYTPRDDLGKIYRLKARTDACFSLMDRLGIKSLEEREWGKHLQKTSFDLGENLAGRDFNVALMPGDGSYVHKTFRNQTKTALESAGMRVALPGQQAVGKKAERAWKHLEHLQHMVERNDAFVFLPSGAHAMDDKTRELELVHAISYAIIHKMLDPAGADKLIMFLSENPKEFNRIATQFEAHFNKGALGDRPSEMIVWARSEEHAAELLKEHKREYRPVPLHNEADNANVPDWKKRTGKYNVCVFLSASMQGVAQDKAEALGKRIQALDMTLVYGAADRHMMGGVYDGMRAAARTASRKSGKQVTPVMMGSTTPAIGATENEHGTKPEHLPDDWFYLAPDITKRKEFLFKNSHAFVMLEGGVGTLDELLTYMHYKQYDPEMVRDKPFVVSESAYTKDPIFKTQLSYYLGKDITKLNDADRERMYKKTGIMVMKAPENLPNGSRKTLYQLEMDNVITFLDEHRARHYPHLVPEKEEKWVDKERERSSQQIGAVRP